jgi:hypothetical protein
MGGSLREVARHANEHVTPLYPRLGMSLDCRQRSAKQVMVQS